MSKRLRTYCLVLLLLNVGNAAAWDWWPLAIAEQTEPAFRDGNDTLAYSFSIEGLASSGKFAPFWLQTNQHGRISAAPFSGYVTAAVEKSATSPERWYDYDFAIELSGAAHSTQTGIFQEGMSHFPYWNGKNGAFQINRLYAHTRLYIIDITAGIRPNALSVPDEELSTGGLLFSNNTMPMPGISIGIDEYTPFPGCYGYLEFKGHIEHNWLTDDAYVRGGYLHYKYAGARAGGKLPINLSYEVQHIAQWGGTSPEYGDLGNDARSFWNAVIAGSGGNVRSGQLLAQGNHIVTQKVQLDVKVSDWNINAYWQTIYEDHSMAFMVKGTNMADGLWGINVSQRRWPYINGVCFEYIGTTDQSGPFHDQDGIIYAGNDDYFQHSIYRNGWSYFGRTIGTPFITSPLYNEDGSIQTLNNRVKVWHVGVKGDIYGFRYRLLASHALNYGTYWDDDIYSIKSHNTAILMEINTHVEKAWGLDFGLRLAGDIGNQFGNTFGGMLTVSKKGIITNW